MDVVSASTDPVSTAKEKVDTLFADMSSLLGPAYASYGAKDDLLAKLDTVNWAIASGSYADAVAILRSDVLPRLDGCQSSDQADINDAVVVCDLQRQYYAAADEAATLLASADVSTVVTSEVAGTLTAGGGWVAYSFQYVGDNSKLGLLLTYSPSTDPYGTDSPVLEVFGPISTPPGGAPLGTATQLGDTSGQTAQRYVQVQYNQGGTYVAIVHNWDGLGRDLNFSLRTVAIDPQNPNNDVRSDQLGPALTFVSAGR